MRTRQPEYTKVRGVSYDGRQDILKNLSRRGLAGITARFQREPENAADSSAVRVELVHEPTGRTCHIGYLSERADGGSVDAGIRVDRTCRPGGGPHYRIWIEFRLPGGRGGVSHPRL